jgi:flagellar basal body-associated protein FliL
MPNEPQDPVSKRLWITLTVLLVLLVAVGAAIAMLSEG